MVSELDDPIWPCIECLPKVVSDFVGEQSRVHIMPISAKWKHKSSIHIGFIVFNGGVTTFFAKSVYSIPDYRDTLNEHIDGLVQERRNSSALAKELCLSWIKPSIW